MYFSAQRKKEPLMPAGCSWCCGCVYGNMDTELAIFIYAVTHLNLTVLILWSPGDFCQYKQGQIYLSTTVKYYALSDINSNFPLLTLISAGSSTKGIHRDNWLPHHVLIKSCVQEYPRKILYLLLILYT